MIKPVFAVVSDIQIVEAVVVVIACADALSPARGSQAGLFGYVGKSAVMVVVEEMIGRRRSSVLRVQRSSIHNEDVWPAVVVIIDYGDAGPRGLDDVLFRRLVAGDDLKLQAGFFGGVLKVGDRRLRPGQLRQSDGH